MCKHVLNAQVSIRAQCCKGWFDCSQCHKEKTDHELHVKIENEKSDFGAKKIDVVSNELLCEWIWIEWLDNLQSI